MRCAGHRQHDRRIASSAEAHCAGGIVWCDFVAGTDGRRLLGEDHVIRLVEILSFRAEAADRLRRPAAGNRSL